MKKVISFVVAIALVLSMSVCAFAAEKPTDVPSDATALATYYAELLEGGAANEDVAAEMIADAQAGIIDSNNYMDMFIALIDLGVDQTVVMNIIMKTTAGFEDAGIQLPDINDIIPSEPETEESSTLEEDETEGESSGSFLDTILGILGGLGDILFGGDGETPEDPTEDENDDPWNDEESTTNSGDSQVPNQGDTSVIAVATVALVAGAALVLTRKKSEDAE